MFDDVCNVEDGFIVGWDISVVGDFRGLTPVRGFTPGPNGDLSRRNSKKERRFNGSNGNGNVDKAMSPQRQVDKAMSPRPTEKAMSPRPDVPVILEAPEERLQSDSAKTSNGEKVEENESIDQPPQQSYLALTKLGGPDKKVEAKPTQPTSIPASQGIKKVKRNVQNQQQEATGSSGFISLLKGR